VSDNKETLECSVELALAKYFVGFFLWIGLRLLKRRADIEVTYEPTFCAGSHIVGFFLVSGWGSHDLHILLGL